MKGIEVGPCRFQIGIICTRIESHKYHVVVQHHIATLYMSPFGQIENAVVRNLAVNHFISFLFIFTGRDDIGVDYFIVDNKAYIPGKYLVAVFNVPGTKHLYIVLLQYLCECRHLSEYCFFSRIDASDCRFVRFGVVGFFRNRRFSHGARLTEHHCFESVGLVSDVQLHVFVFCKCIKL